jgi:hypothetical protein
MSLPSGSVSTVQVKDCAAICFSSDVEKFGRMCVRSPAECCPCAADDHSGRMDSQAVSNGCVAIILKDQ